MKYYAVRRGRIPGIYSNYLDAWKQTQGFSNAKMKAFKTLGEAKAFVGKVPNRSQKNVNGNFYVVNFNDQETVFLSTERVVNFLIAHPGATLRRYFDFGALLQNIRKKGIVLYTDGSYIESYGCYSGAFVAVDSEKNVVHEERFTGQQTRFIEARNNAGEALAIVRALKWAVANQYQEIMIVTDSDNVVQWINGNRANLPICSYFINQLKHFRQNSQIEIHFKVVKAHAQTYYNNYVDQLTREVIYKEKADNHLCYQLMNDDQFLRDFLNKHPRSFAASQTETFRFYKAKELNTQTINWVPAEQAIVMIGDLPNTYGTYLMLMYNQGSRLKRMVGKIHSRNLFIKN